MYKCTTLTGVLLTGSNTDVCCIRRPTSTRKAGCTRQIVHLTRSPFIVTRCEQTPLSQKKTICYVSLATLLLQFKSEFKRASTFLCPFDRDLAMGFLMLKYCYDYQQLTTQCSKIMSNFPCAAGIINTIERQDRIFSDGRISLQASLVVI